MSEDDEYVTASERHYQIMLDGERFFRRLFYGCFMIIVVIAGSVIFFLFKYHP